MWIFIYIIKGVGVMGVGVELVVVKSNSRENLINGVSIEIK